MHEYDLIADWYPSDRGRSVGVREALAAVASLPRDARVLDVGCGNGFPITDALVNAGYRVVGIDSSRGMLERFRVNLPTTSVVGGDARASPFAENVFDAAISWGMMFHLTRGDQTTAFANVSRVLKLGAPFLFTAAEIAEIAGDDAGTTSGWGLKCPADLYARSSRISGRADRVPGMDRRKSPAAHQIHCAARRQTGRRRSPELARIDPAAPARRVATSEYTKSLALSDVSSEQGSSARC
jgi:SAM-dependent methyltransferase